MSKETEKKIALLFFLLLALIGVAIFFDKKRDAS